MRWQYLLDSLATQPPCDGPRWLGDVRRGDFAAIPEDVRWETGQELAILIDGYALAEALGLPEVGPYMAQQFGAAGESGRWPGDAVDLWLSLFLQQRYWRQAYPQEPDASTQRLLDLLCHQLREALIALSADQRPEPHG